MASRDDVINQARSQLGVLDNTGFDGPNPFSADLGLPPEAWCADFVTWVFKHSGVPLPSMQTGHPTGYSYCPDAVEYGRAHGAGRPSWEAVPGDIFLFDWNGDGVSDHTEIMVGKNGNDVITIGGNSGPDGGVNQHDWNCPPGQGNDAVLLTLNAEALVSFANPNPTPAPIPPPQPQDSTPPWPGRLLVLKSPMLNGGDVQQWQGRMHDRGWDISVDGWYGPQSRDTCVQFQQEKGLGVDGIVGPVTWATSFRTDNVT